jgi:predicted TPR repeat methyltransferase
MPGRQRRGRTDYRSGWRGHEAASAYEEDLRREESEAGWLGETERRLLADVVDRRFDGREIRYLDFACGTGRIIAFLEERVSSATGIDASPEMLELARAKLTKAELICGDVTVNSSVLPGRYDLVTAFRFFLNAGETLRSEVLRVLHGALADDGILVFNLHSNTWSLRSLSVLFRRHVLGQAWWNQRSFLQVRRELRDHGFQVIELHGYNFLTGKGYRLVPTAAIPAIERSLARVRPFRYLGVHLLFVCRKAPLRSSARR